ncbi:glycosyltransferase [Caldiplasma sukawensis]
MKIAIIIPVIEKISGNRMALEIAEVLSSRHSVDILCYHVWEGILPEVSKIIKKANLVYIKKDKEKIKEGLGFAVRYQLSNKISRKLANILDRNGYDLAVNISNECHSIPFFTKNKKMINSVLVMELHENGFLSMQKKSSLSGVIHFIAPVFYPFIKFIEYSRFSAHDLIFSNSKWTKILFQYFYEIPVASTLIYINENRFVPMSKNNTEKFILVPTASIEKDIMAKEILTRLKSEKIKVKVFGSYKIEGFENLGYLEQENLIKMYSEARATLFLFNYEALGLIPFESLLCGTPVITYRKQGVGVELEDNPYVYMYDTADEIINKCKEVMAMEKSPSEIKGCRESILKFSGDKIIETLEKTYQEAIKRRH